MFKKLASVVAVSIMTFGCGERDTLLSVEGGAAPTFVMSGSGSLGNLRVRGPAQQRDAPGEKAFIYWQIEVGPKSTPVPVERLGKIQYGTIPTGYVQVYPESGTPPALAEGRTYYVYASTLNANGAGKNFVMEHGKAVEQLE